MGKMKRSFWFVCLCVALCFMSSVLYGKAVRDPNGVYAYNHSGDPSVDPNLAWHTINDWVKIGDPNYANYISLWSNTDVTEDSITNPNMNGPVPNWESGFEDRCDLIMYADMGPAGQAYVVPVDTWCGYQWTVPDMNESIVSIQISGFSNFAPVFSELRVLDDANNIIGNYIPMPPWYPSSVQWFHSFPDYDPTGKYFYKSTLPKTPTVEFPVNGSKSVKLVYYMKGNWWPYPQTELSVWDNKVWTGNFFWIYLPRIRTVMDSKCGAGNDLSRPVGDINGDCIVNLQDYVQLAVNWMVNGQYTAPASTNDLDDQCGGGNDHLFPRVRSAGDLNSDCTIDIKDLVMFVSTWFVDNR